MLLLLLSQPEWNLTQAIPMMAAPLDSPDLLTLRKIIFECCHFLPPNKMQSEVVQISIILQTSAHCGALHPYDLPWQEYWSGLLLASPLIC